MQFNKYMKKNFIYIFLTLFFFSKINIALSLNVEIIAKVENEIITNIDVNNESLYLKSLNPSLKNINNQDLLNFAKDSAIKEVIKKIELQKIYELDQKNQVIDLNIEQIYKKIGFETLDQFKNYLADNKLKFEEVYKKIEIETAWNQLVYSTYKDKIVIDEKELEQSLDLKSESISYLLREIVFNYKTKDEIQNKYSEIKTYIIQNGFEKAVIDFSISQTKKDSGLIGWVSEKSLTQDIKEKISKLNIGDIMDPILIPSGVLILKLEDKKISVNEKDKNIELEKLISFEMNNQLNNFSNIHFKKIKNKLIINEY
jgi:peptidyl-prolyl cis-trans isomerase SurA